ncbi:hypothetical protein K020075H21_11110 [Bacteroides ovatus]
MIYETDTAIKASDKLFKIIAPNMFEEKDQTFSGMNRQAYNNNCKKLNNSVIKNTPTIRYPFRLAVVYIPFNIWKLKMKSKNVSIK